MYFILKEINNKEEMEFKSVLLFLMEMCDVKY